jgi:hypothetical protein
MLFNILMKSKKANSGAWHEVQDGQQSHATVASSYCVSGPESPEHCQTGNKVMQ